MSKKISEEEYNKILNEVHERNKNGVTIETIRNFKGTTQEFCEKYGFTTTWEEFDKEMREKMNGCESGIDNMSDVRVLGYDELILRDNKKLINTLNEYALSHNIELDEDTSYIALQNGNILGVIDVVAERIPNLYHIASPKSMTEINIEGIKQFHIRNVVLEDSSNLELLAYIFTYIHGMVQGTCAEYYKKNNCDNIVMWCIKNDKVEFYPIFDFEEMKQRYSPPTKLGYFFANIFVE